MINMFVHKVLEKIKNLRRVSKILLLIGIQVISLSFAVVAGLFSNEYVFSDISASITKMASMTGVVVLSSKQKNKDDSDAFLKYSDYLMNENNTFYDKLPFQCAVIYNENKSEGIQCSELGLYGTELSLLPLSTAGSHLDTKNDRILNQYYFRLLSTNGISTNRPNGMPYCAISKKQADYLLSTGFVTDSLSSSSNKYDLLVGKQLNVTLNEKTYAYYLGGVFDDEFGFATHFSKAFDNFILSYYLMPNTVDYYSYRVNSSFVFAL